MEQAKYSKAKEILIYNKSLLVVSQMMKESWYAFANQYLAPYYSKLYHDTIEISGFKIKEVNPLYKKCYYAQFFLRRNGEDVMLDDFRFSPFVVYAGMSANELPAITKLWRKFLCSEFKEYPELLRKYKDNKRQQVLEEADERLKRIDDEFADLL